MAFSFVDFITEGGGDIYMFDTVFKQKNGGSFSCTVLQNKHIREAISMIDFQTEILGRQLA